MAQDSHQLASSEASRERFESMALSSLARLSPSRPSDQPRILCYHGVRDSPVDDRYAVGLEQFEEHVALASSLTAPATADDHWATGLSITFDDNLRSHAATATPILAAAGLTATFYLNVGLLGSDAELAMTDVTTMIEAGMGIGAHNDVHQVVSQMPIDDFIRSAQRCARFCDDLEQPRSWAYPGGFLGSFTPEQDRILHDMGFWRYTTVEGDPNGDRAQPQPRYVVRRYTTTAHIEAIASGKLRFIGRAKTARFRFGQIGASVRNR